MSNLLHTPTVNDECHERFVELNRGINPMWRLIIYKLNKEETEVIVDHCCDYTSTEEDVKRVLEERISPQNPAWIAMTISFYVENGGRRDKTVFITWIPDTIERETLKESARVKMMSLSCSGALKKVLKGVVCFIESNTPDELSFDYLLQKASKNEREPVVFKMVFN